MSEGVEIPARVAERRHETRGIARDVGELDRVAARIGDRGEEAIGADGERRALPARRDDCRGRAPRIAFDLRHLAVGVGDR